MKKKLIITGAFGLALVVVLSVPLYSKSKKKVVELNLACSNGYTMTAIYHSPNKDGILSKLLLTVVANNKKETYNMKSTMSASGAKFQTSDGKYFLWEHQDVFMFGSQEKNITDCKQQVTAKMEEFKDIQVRVCQKELGCAPSIKRQEGHMMLFEPKTEEATKAYNEAAKKCADKKIRWTPKATVTGIIVKEKGHFPNPMAEFEVLKAYTYKENNKE